MSLNLLTVLLEKQNRHFKTTHVFFNISINFETRSILRTSDAQQPIKYQVHLKKLSRRFPTLVPGFLYHIPLSTVIKIFPRSRKNLLCQIKLRKFKRLHNLVPIVYIGRLILRACTLN